MKHRIPDAFQGNSLSVLIPARLDLGWALFNPVADALGAMLSGLLEAALDS
jgi:hypothetical protein